MALQTDNPKVKVKFKALWAVQTHNVVVLGVSRRIQAGNRYSFPEKETAKIMNQKAIGNGKKIAVSSKEEMLEMKKAGKLVHVQPKVEKK